ncbi:MAG: hypothetical protein M1819_003291 [Sarea resinae]|nr:MAG: hypothetical protein M1819_003291 [Sarea resinae]
MVDDEEVQHPQGGSQAGAPEAPVESTNRTDSKNLKSSRKRTKTGCLTCRKRRIKCGEEKPICNNCVKSKRNCEGYSQRVIFKDPLNAASSFRFNRVAPPNGALLSFSHGVTSNSDINSTSLPAIAPRPLDQNDYPSTDPAFLAMGSGIEETLSHHQPGLLPGPQPGNPDPIPGPWERGFGSSFQQQTAPATSPPAASGRGMLSRGETGWQYPGQAPEVQRNHQQASETWQQHLQHVNAHVQRSYGNIPDDVYRLPQQQPISGTTDEGDTFQFPDQFNDSRLYLPEAPIQQQATFREEWPSFSDQQYPTNYLGGQNCLEAALNEQNNLGRPAHTSEETSGEIGEDVARDPRFNQTSRWDDYEGLGQDADILGQDDDYWDVESDDGMPEEPAQGHNRPDMGVSSLGLLRALQASQDDSRMRSFTSFLNEPNMLRTYRPKAMASPLMDAKTARLFCHFITATGPSISMYERNPTNPSAMLTGIALPISQQSLWTHILPSMALNHQGLLHAMLAIASLHIAKLQNSSTTPSLKHYHYALRRIGRCVVSSRRHESATLAATLILGFYEVMTAEHAKWNSHLAGAMQLMMEIDFAGMTKRIRASKGHAGYLKMDRSDAGDGSLVPQALFSVGGPKTRPSKVMEVDEKLVSIFIGRRLRYDIYGHVIIEEDHETESPPRTRLSPHELEDFDTKTDLFWWYCKQDMFHSIVSGNGLLLDYERWGSCPPRAPLGRLDAIYGTMDHLLLLMGRIADFTARDQRRKRKVLDANGGFWRPPAGMSVGPPGRAPGPRGNQEGPSHSSGPIPPGVPIPPMYGMVPGIGPTKLPSAFESDPASKRHKDNSPTLDTVELGAANVEAVEEWNQIRAAFRIFEESLGPDFQPLSSEYMQPLSTPFGPALQYRTYSIACIHAIYLMGLIIAIRSHPDMPPAPSIAAGIAAPRTAALANDIGRIAAGIRPTPPSQPLSPSLGAALQESSLPLFFAGVQYQDPSQRRWLISRLLDISRRTGWQSSTAIANGCESAWTAMAKAGRGPPWERSVLDPKSEDERLAGRNPHETGVPPKDNSDRRFVTVHTGARVHWAIGLLGTEEDFANMTI